MSWKVQAVKNGEQVIFRCVKQKDDTFREDFEVTLERVQWFWTKVVLRLDKEACAKDCFAKIIKVLGLTGTVTVDSFNGGKNRAKYYFPYYYHPMKVLNHLGYVEMAKGSKTFKRRLSGIRIVVDGPIESKDASQVTLDKWFGGRR